MNTNRWITLILFVTSLLLGVLSWRGVSNAANLIEWSTATELDTVGFNLYRSEHPDGPFTQVNGALIPASIDPLTGGEYSQQDTEISSGVLYYYYLEEIDAAGNSGSHGPIEIQSGYSGVFEGLAAVVFLFAAAIYFRISEKATPNE